MITFNKATCVGRTKTRVIHHLTHSHQTERPKKARYLSLPHLLHRVWQTVIARYRGPHRDSAYMGSSRRRRNYSTQFVGDLGDNDPYAIPQ